MTFLLQGRSLALAALAALAPGLLLAPSRDSQVIPG